MTENYYHGECANCKSKIYGECEGADYSNDAEFYSCYSDFEEEKIYYDYEEDIPEEEELTEAEMEKQYHLEMACDRYWNTDDDYYDDIEYEY